MALVMKNLPANTGDAGDTGLVAGSTRSPEEGNGNPFQCSSQARIVWRYREWVLLAYEQ